MDPTIFLHDVYKHAVIIGFDIGLGAGLGVSAVLLILSILYFIVINLKRAICKNDKPNMYKQVHLHNPEILHLGNA